MADTGKPRSGSIAARVVVRLADFVAARGHDPEAMCRSVGVSLLTLREHDARIPYPIAERIGMRALELTRDANLGLHLAQDIRETTSFDAGVLLMMASPSLGVSLERMARYQEYWADGARFGLVPRRGGVAVRYQLQEPISEYQRHSDECAMAEIVLGARRLTGQELVPVAVHFRHPEPADTREHSALFRAPLRFAARHCEVEFTDAALATPLPNANETYRAFFQQHVERALARLPGKSGVASDVRAAARAALASGDCTLAGTARALGVSVRTMQRRLRADGTSFGALVDALRRELASEYLAQHVPVQQIAWLLGYGEASAFHHAFKRWTGMTPEQARAQVRGAG
jgi:AraC-like DNA-binding protein